MSPVSGDHTQYTRFPPQYLFFIPTPIIQSIPATVSQYPDIHICRKNNLVPIVLNNNNNNVGYTLYLISLFRVDGKITVSLSPQLQGVSHLATGAPG